MVLLGAALGALLRGRAQDVDRPQNVQTARALPAAVPALGSSPVHRRRSFGARLALAATFATLFVAGGSLAAWGGNEAAQITEAAPARASADPIAEPTTDAADAVVAETTVAEAPVVAPVSSDETPAAAPVAAATDAVVADAPVPAPVAADEGDLQTPASVAAPDAPAPVASAPVVRRSAAKQRTARAVTRAKPVVAPAPDPQSESAGASVIWLNQAPDPTPAGPPLTRAFVHALVGRAGQGWPFALALLRVRGANVTGRRLLSRESQLSPDALRWRGDWPTALALTGSSSSADRAVALAHYYRAVGDETLVNGLASSRARLARRLLADPRVTLTGQGRGDIVAGRVNERVLAVIAYLADTFGSVEVSSLVSGHRLYARPRVLSAHVFGEAVDIAALGGESIAGHQQVGGITEQAVRDLLYLPAENEPRQVISLLGLGGPSFALADHADHIHIGF